MGEQKNLIMALGLSFAFMYLYTTFYLEPKMEAERAAYELQVAAEQKKNGGNPKVAVPKGSQAPVLGSDNNALKSVATTLADALSDTNRIRIETPELVGSMSLRGAIIDDLSLVNHKVTMDLDSDLIRLMTPAGVKGEKAYYARFGWMDQQSRDMTTEKTLWTADKNLLTPSSPVTLSFTNASGVTFKQRISVDDQFMFTVEQIVENRSTGPVSVAPNGYVLRQGPVATDGLFILHEGPIAALGAKGDNKELIEADYDELAEDKVDQSSDGGWLGITDKFWMTILIPDQNEAVPFARMRDMKGAYKVDFYNNLQEIPAGSTATMTNRMFAGAKIVSAINGYEEDLGIEIFNKTIDWGWFHYLTRPIFWALHEMVGIFGNFGVAILLLTVLIKLVLFPLANKQYVSMAHMKKVQPQIKKMQERYKDDRTKLQQEMMALYKKEKINPMAGCLPIFLQIPIFFSLYKVLYVTIDMRHQPFFGWIQDLSAPDPLTPLNFFGLIPWDPPSMIAVGVWPIMMGLSMWLQQKMNPTTMEPAQQKIMGMLPIVFTFILANFSAGLVIYWTWNSLLSVLQQWVIMRREEAKTSS